MPLNEKKRRFIQIYTGNGKGKTTAAMGQAIRAAGQGMQILIIMFMKSYQYSELTALERFADRIKIERYGDDEFVLKKQPPSEEDLNTARRGLDSARRAMIAKKFDLIILDEICVAAYFKLVDPKQITELLNDKPEDVELILTGRYCPQQWIEKADLVTEMREIKHYYQKGILARRGFDS